MAPSSAPGGSGSPAMQAGSHALPIAFSYGSAASVMAGELAQASARLDELETIAEAIGSPIRPPPPLCLSH